MTPESVTSVRELDCRASQGLQVRLLWREHDDSVWVSVIDIRTRQAFRLRVGADQAPLEVFHHPFAYAACEQQTACAPVHRRLPSNAGGGSPEGRDGRTRTGRH
jgi:hypothetical protein